MLHSNTLEFHEFLAYPLTMSQKWWWIFIWKNYIEILYFCSLGRKNKYQVVFRSYQVWNGLREKYITLPPGWIRRSQLSSIYFSLMYRIVDIIHRKSVRWMSIIKTVVPEHIQRLWMPIGDIYARMSDEISFIYFPFRLWERGLISQHQKKNLLRFLPFHLSVNFYSI